MDPIPETLEALRALARSGDVDVATTLHGLDRDVSRVVPEIVGISVGLACDPFTFTLVADSELVQETDAIQYVDDGPCLAAMRTGDVTATTTDDLMDEGRWQLFARSLAIHGIESTLSLPVLRDGRVVAGVNLYASTPDAFVGHHDELAAICGAWAPGVVANADLTFTTLLEAVETPERMRDQDVVDQAVGMLVSARGLSVSAAATRIRQAAARAGISQSQAARRLISVLSVQQPPQQD